LYDGYTPAKKSNNGPVSCAREFRNNDNNRTGPRQRRLSFVVFRSAAAVSGLTVTKKNRKSFAGRSVPDVVNETADGIMGEKLPILKGILNGDVRYHNARTYFSSLFFRVSPRRSVRRYPAVSGPRRGAFVVYRRPSRARVPRPLLYASRANDPSITL